MTIENAKIIALAKYLECEMNDLSESRYDDSTFNYGSREYLVLTDDEADEKAKENIKESLWAFNASFLSGYLPEGIDEEVITLLQEKCESSNEAFKKMLGDTLDDFIDDAISSDGRGNFMNSYDGNEYEEGNFYIYRTN